MTQTTPKGFPFPVGTDRVADGDNAMEALARAVDASVQTGTGTIAAGQGTSPAFVVTQLVTFPNQMTTVTPAVVVASSSQPDTVVSVLTNTNANFTVAIQCRNNAGAAVATLARTFTWIAAI